MKNLCIERDPGEIRSGYYCSYELHAVGYFVFTTINYIIFMNNLHLLNLRP